VAMVEKRRQQTKAKIAAKSEEENASADFRKLLKKRPTNDEQSTDTESSPNEPKEVPPTERQPSTEPKVTPQKEQEPTQQNSPVSQVLKTVSQPLKSPNRPLTPEQKREEKPKEEKPKEIKPKEEKPKEELPSDASLVEDIQSLLAKTSSTKKSEKKSAGIFADSSSSGSLLFATDSGNSGGLFE